MCIQQTFSGSFSPPAGANHATSEASEQLMGNEKWMKVRTSSKLMLSNNKQQTTHNTQHLHTVMLGALSSWHRFCNHWHRGSLRYFHVWCSKLSYLSLDVWMKQLDLLNQIERMVALMLVAAKLPISLVDFMSEEEMVPQKAQVAEMVAIVQSARWTSNILSLISIYRSYRLLRSKVGVFAHWATLLRSHNKLPLLRYWDALQVSHGSHAFS